jgi:hypothetical protein
VDTVFGPLALEVSTKRTISDEGQLCAWKLARHLGEGLKRHLGFLAVGKGAHLQKVWGSGHDIRSVRDQQRNSVTKAHYSTLKERPKHSADALRRSSAAPNVQINKAARFLQREQIRHCPALDRGLKQPAYKAS